MIAKNITFLRGRNSLSEFAEIIGKTTGTVRNYENRKSLPDVEVLQRISKQYDVGYYELIEVDLANKTKESYIDLDTLSKEDLKHMIMEFRQRMSNFGDQLSDFIASKLKESF